MKSILKLLLVAAVAFWVFRSLRGGQDVTPAGLKLPDTQTAAVGKARAAGKKLVILITGSKWCPPCQLLEKQVLSTPEWEAFAKNEILFEIYDYPAAGDAPTPAHRDLVSLEGVRGFPTVVVADQGGNVTGMRSGFGGDPADLISWIRSH